MVPAYLIKESSKIVLKLFLKKTLHQLWNSKFLRVDWYQNFQKNRTRTCFLSCAKYLSSVKCIFDLEKDQNRNFCQARMKVYDLGYLFLGWISSSKCASREKHKKHQKFRNHSMFFKQIYIIIEFWARKKLKIKNQIRRKFIIWFE